jgi:hypothetical protein
MTTSIPAPANPADPVSEGLAILVDTGVNATVRLLACTECGVLLWDVERHWRDAHSNRLAALRAILAREKPECAHPEQHQHRAATGRVMCGVCGEVRDVAPSG